MASSKKEELLATHRKQLKELQSKIQGLKHGVSKGDKKRKKQVAVEIALMEAELSQKQEEELAELEKNESPKQETLNDNHQNDLVVDTSSQQKVSNGPLECATGEVQDPPDICANKSDPQKVTKAQKRRNKKAAKAKEREEAIVQQEADNLSGARHLETQKLNSKLSERGLSIHEVPSDGDCLYKALEHQLSNLNIRDTSVEELRQETCDYMLDHKDDFQPFLTNGANSEDLMSDVQYENYCRDIASKPTWGGHVEIQALAHVCKSPIEVIQADGPNVLAGVDYGTEKKLILCYHRHMYGLGEHYNSVTSSTEQKEEEEKTND